MIINILNFIFIVLSIVFSIAFIIRYTRGASETNGGWKIILGAILLALGGALGIFQDKYRQMNDMISSLDIVYLALITLGLTVLFIGIFENYYRGKQDNRSLNERIRKLSVIKKINESIFRKPALVELLNNSLEWILQLLRLKGGIIHIYNPKDGSLVMGAFNGMPLSVAGKMEVIPHDDIFISILKKGESSSIPERYFASINPSDRIEYGYRSALSAPLIDDGKILGSITLFSKQIRFFKENTRDDIKQCAAALSSAISQLKKERYFEQQLSALNARSKAFDLLVEMGNRQLRIMKNSERIRTLTEKIASVFPESCVSAVSIDKRNYKIKLLSSTGDIYLNNGEIELGNGDEFLRILEELALKNIDDKEKLPYIWHKKIRDDIFAGRKREVRSVVVIPAGLFREVQSYIFIESYKKRSYPESIMKCLQFISEAVFLVYHQDNLKANITAEYNQFRYLTEIGISMSELSDPLSFDKQLCEAVHDLDKNFQGVFVLSLKGEGDIANLTGYCDPEKRTAIKNYNADYRIFPVVRTGRIYNRDEIDEDLKLVMGNPTFIFAIPFKGDSRILVIATYADDETTFSKANFDSAKWLLRIVNPFLRVQRITALEKSAFDSAENIAPQLADNFSDLLDGIYNNSRRILDRLNESHSLESTVKPQNLRIWLEAVERAADEGRGVLNRMRKRTDRINMNNEEKAKKPLKILVVDDNFELLKTAEMMFNALGHVPVTALDAYKALDIIAVDKDFDLIFTDLGLPGIDGLDFIRQVRSNGFTNPIVVVTAADEELTPEVIRDLDIMAGAEKPFTLDSLTAVVKQTREVLNRKNT
ncbi:MAG: response regulator [candidate division Zixibacteria bacterium]|nr:response regulator [candidate division Zixibacteria bacterium]